MSQLVLLTGGAYLLRTQYLGQSGYSLWCALPAVASVAAPNFLPRPAYDAWMRVPVLNAVASPEAIGAVIGGALGMVAEAGGGLGGGLSAVLRFDRRVLLAGVAGGVVAWGMTEAAMYVRAQYGL